MNNCGRTRGPAQPATCPAIMIAGTHSGCGKTTLALGLMAALRQRGLVMQAGKCGPDFIDPSLHRLVTGRPSPNLDPWMMGPEFTRAVFRQRAADAQITVIEGVMGLFDGGPSSSAALARLLEVPVILVVDARSMAESAAALVRGFADHDPAVRVAGVIFNQVGGPRHRELLHQAMTEYGEVSVLGMVPRATEIAIPERHLGLMMGGEEGGLDEAAMERLVALVEEHVALERLLEIACCRAPFAGPQPKWGQTPFFPFEKEKMVSDPILGILPASEVAAASLASMPPAATKPGQSGLRPSGNRHTSKTPGAADCANTGIDHAENRRAEIFPVAVEEKPIRIGVARDAAFCFYYEENLDLWRAAGAEVVEFSPLVDPALPPGLDAVYLGGGYPELHAAKLTANRGMRETIREWSEAGRPLYAECGGFMYLSEELVDLEGAAHAMAGVFPVQAVMRSRRQRLGHRQALCRADNLLGPAGAMLRGHEFHYSETSPMPPEVERIAADDEQQAEIYRLRESVAGYLHLHFGSRPQSAAWLVDYCRNKERT